MIDEVRIPYEEYKAINELMHAHLKTHEGQLRALIAFGPLVTRGNTFDIDLLEVVDGWEGPDNVTFSSTAELPLRGLLRLNVLSTADFETPDRLKHFQMKRLIHDLPLAGYETIYENPSGYVDRILRRADEATASINPLTFLDAGKKLHELPR